jgi:hypothetical protein
MKKTLVLLTAFLLLILSLIIVSCSKTSFTTLLTTQSPIKPVATSTAKPTQSTTTSTTPSETPTNPYNENIAINNLATSPDYANDHTIYAATTLGFFRSTDSGNSRNLEVISSLQ